ncbi:MAG: ribosome silencing factor [Burkholderiales bacterium]|nr:ribosome silencing factor [Burkholderiales bacterium]MDE1928042.1 ribosome silencing factor [Burkholderiales bacterium]MDE2160575.1 ribosome silencing factor [Burkholderiales bacterium]MDE2502697.1 ribosome silencing factor [Burkholderiales bacterium]
MDIRKLQRAIVDGLEDVKAQHIAVFNTEHLSSMFERVIIASGTSNRQTKALAASVRDAVKSRGMQVMSTEGEDNGEWIIVDCGAAVAHIMQPAIREYYHLEEIWGGKSVRIKIGATEHKLVKASEPEPAPKPAARAASGAAPRKSAPRPPALKTPPKSAARKTAPRTPASKAENLAAAYKRVAAKKAPSRSKVTTVVASRKTPPRKTTARKVPR